MKILKTIPCEKSQWIQPKQVIYENDSGAVLRWDYIERTDARQTVLILPRFTPSGDFLFVRQYRVIFDRYVIGFPAGILDEEDIEACAFRELLEETGYTGRTVRVSPPLTSNSALVKELSHCVNIAIEDDAIPVDQDLEPSEIIEAHRVPQKRMERFFQEAADRGDIIGGGLWYLLMALV